MVLKVNGTIFGHHCLKYILESYSIDNEPIYCFMTLQQLLHFFKLFKVDELIIEKTSNYVKLKIANDELYIFDPLTSEMPFKFEFEAMQKSSEEIEFFLRKSIWVKNSFCTVFKNIENKITYLLDSNVSKEEIHKMLNKGWEINATNIKVKFKDLSSSCTCTCTCAICKQSIDTHVIKITRCCTRAKYIFHPNCFKKHMTKCPLCNIPFQFSPIDKTLLEL